MKLEVVVLGVSDLAGSEEIAQAIVFLASEKASFITGASYLVEGGKTAQ